MDPDRPSPASRDRPPPDSALFDDSQWPLLLLRLPGTLSSTGHEACLDALAAYLGRGERFVLVVDLARVGLVPLEQRWRQVEWFETHESALLSFILGSSVVVTSPLARLSLSAILHFKRVVLPMAICTELPGALAWAHQRLREAGLGVPPPPDKS